jgi:hypothetical protein
MDLNLKENFSDVITIAGDMANEAVSNIADVVPDTSTVKIL